MQEYTLTSAVALTSTTAKTVYSVTAPSGTVVTLPLIRLSTGEDVPTNQAVLVEVFRFTSGHTLGGTATTGTVVAQTATGRAAAATVKHTYTVEPTLSGGTIETVFADYVPVRGGVVEVRHGGTTLLESGVAGGFAIRLTAGSTSGLATGRQSVLHGER